MAIVFLLMITIAVPLIAIPTANAQPPLIMNLPGQDGVIHYVILGTTNYDIDLNGGPGAGNNLELWSRNPGETEFTLHATLPTRSNGDLDYYDYVFDTIGEYAFYWAYPGNASISNIEIAMVATLDTMPPAHDPPWEITSFPYIVPAPNPVGVGQRVLIVMWIDRPLPDANVNNDVRRKDYKLTITAPDDSTEIFEWPIVTDSTSIQYVSYTPDQVGTYTLLFEYAGQLYNELGSFFKDTFMPASKTVTLTVQEDPLPDPTTSYPLPTEYWTRPIEGQNTDWWKISSNWLGNPFIDGAGTSYGIPGGIQPDGAAPNSAHIMWSRPIQDGGVVGGSGYHVEGTTYYMGGSYNTRFANPLIMHGRLYYEVPLGNSGSGGGWICVDLRTGEEIWRDYEMGTGGFFGTPEPYFGYLYDLDMYNQHGITGNGWLFSSNFGAAWDPLTGREVGLNLDDVPSGTATGGPQGEVLRYQWSRTRQWIAQWNSSKVFSSSSSSTYDASDPDSYDWNISIPLFPSGSSIRFAEAEDTLLISNIAREYGGGFSAWGTNDPYTVAAISIAPESRGQVLFNREYSAPAGDVSRSLEGMDPVNRVFVMAQKETGNHLGYDLDSGALLWGPTESANDYTYFRTTTRIAYGKVYFGGYGGIVYTYDVRTGNLDWTYGNGGEGNSTFAGLETAWGTYPVFVDVIADGKLYLATTEHSPGSPYYKNARYRCINATTGEEIWTLLGWGTGMDAGCDVVADGYLAFLNCYDMKVYSVGKGPSATRVSIQNDVVTHGDSVLVKGTVMDIAAGTKQDEQAARFPDGVPAVSEDSMSGWMEYVYMQKPRPTDTVGVDVTLTVLDPNNNVYDVGTTTSDASGMFKLAFVPEVPGEYTVIATFAGSEGYWGSFSETALLVDEAPLPPAPEEPLVLPPTESYITAATIAIIIAIAIVGLLLFRKR
jgi:hypothetical protein